MFDKKAHWERVYEDGLPEEVSWYQKEPTLSLQLIRNTRIATDAPIIDVGGGASLLVDGLCERGFTRLAVLDISPQALAYARERLGDKAQRVEWYEADITTFVPPHRFALWHDRAVFHFLTDQVDRTRYVEVLKRTLEPGGHLLLATFALGGPTRCSGLEIVQYDAAKLGRELGGEFRLVEETSETHVTPTGKQQKFAYFRFVRETKPSGLIALVE